MSPARMSPALPPPAPPRRGWLRFTAGATGVLFALALALGVTAAGLLLLQRLNARTIAPAVDESEKATVIDFTPPPPKKQEQRRPRPKPKAEPTPSRPSVQPLPNAPSSISAARLAAPELDVVGLIDGAALEQDVGRSARLILSEDEVDTKPRLIRRVPPRYPARAADDGVEGEVALRLLVNTQGSVEKVLIERSTPRGVFDDAARAAALRWRFRPAAYQGQKVSVWCRNRLVFKLAEE